MKLRALHQTFILSIGLLGILSVEGLAQEKPDPNAWADRQRPEHDYWNRTPQDPFTRFTEELAAGKHTLDTSGGDVAYLTSLLNALEIPISSQMLVFSTTSLQLRFISPENPRALYFNEDTYIGFIPGGRIEVISMDPELGAIFYIFDLPKTGGHPELDRSRRCMNCHSGTETRRVPGIVIKSVIPGPKGGSLNSFKREIHGHHVAWEERFGGYHVTGRHGITKHLGNITGRLNAGTIDTFANEPGSRFSWSNYPTETSDILAHLLHEHQAGFVNRVVEASYRARSYLAEGGGRSLSPEHRATLETVTDELVAYLLFADETPFPATGIDGDETYLVEFAKNRLPDAEGRSLKDFDMDRRIFKYRCSYMIYSEVFQGLPPIYKQFVLRRLFDAIDGKNSAGAHLARDEREAIRSILVATLPEAQAFAQ